jgi:predicted anti-sigma-YlaC factor YlaD
LTGKLNGAAILPTLCSQMITYSGETIIYLSSATLTCAQMQTSRWLGSAVAGSQVVEVIIKGDPVVGTSYPVPPGEVNYAIGGKSSATEVTASSGTIKYTLVNLQKTVEGTVTATSTDGSTISGTFHAEYCVNGQEY